MHWKLTEKHVAEALSKVSGSIYSPEGFVRSLTKALNATLEEISQPENWPDWMRSIDHGNNPQL